MGWELLLMQGAHKQRFLSILLTPESLDLCRLKYTFANEALKTQGRVVSEEFEAGERIPDKAHLSKGP